jgi:hypothetical protein
VDRAAELSGRCGLAPRHTLTSATQQSSGIPPCLTLQRGPVCFRHLTICRAYLYTIVASIERVQGAEMSDGGTGKSRASDSCKYLYTWQVYAQMTALEDLAMNQSAHTRHSSLLRWPKLRHSLRCPPPASRSPQDARPAVALEYTVWYHSIHSERAESHKAVLAWHATQHTAHRMRVCDILFQPECAATTS